MVNPKFLVLITLGILSFPCSAAISESASLQVTKLFKRLAGTPLSLRDPRRNVMETAVSEGRLLDAADIAVHDDGFINIIIRQVATPMNTAAEDPLAVFSDFTATFMGIVRDDLDGRMLLTGNFIYRANPMLEIKGVPDLHSDFYIYGSGLHYTTLDEVYVNFAQTLVQSPQKGYVYDLLPQDVAKLTPFNLTDTAGLLTSRSWSQAHLLTGTNRRAIQFAVQEFLCTPIREWTDTTNSDARTQRDVNRAPGGNVKKYLSDCRSCHGGLDGMSQAYAYYDSGEDRLGNHFVYFNPLTVVSKYERHAFTYPEGYKVTDNSWINYANRNRNREHFGWNGPLSGYGVHSLGEMYANSDQFPRCMAKRAFTEVCRRTPRTEDQSTVQELADIFRQSGYHFRTLFKRTAIIPGCVIGEAK